MMPVGDLLPELVLLVGAVVVLLFALAAPRRVQVWVAALALATLAAAALAILRDAPTAQRLTFAGTYALDGVAIGGKFLIMAITALVVLLSVDWFRSDARQGEYYAILLMSALGAVLLAGAADLMELTLAILLSSATGYILAAYHRASRRSAEAAIKYYLVGVLANGAMVYGVVLLFGVGTTTVYSSLATQLVHGDAVPVIAGFALTIIGIAFKMGAVPTHTWMPDVADGAPAPVAAFLTAVPKVGALIALAHLVRVVPDSTSGWRILIAVVAGVTMTMGNLAALWQDNVRRLLGWSAVSQTGYALMAIVALGRSAAAIPALVYFLGAYVLGNIAAFGVVIELRGRAERAGYVRLARVHPWLAAALVISFLSFVGIPPLAGFVGKVALFDAVIDAGYGWLAVVAVVNTVISLAYYARVLGPMYFDSGNQMSQPPVPPDATSTRGTWGGVAVAASTLLLILAGIGADPLFTLLQSARLLPR